MYETEASADVESAKQIPGDIAQLLCELTTVISARTLLAWSEHCTECVWPTCYTTCELYTPRADLRCRRFSDGMVRVDIPGSVNGYVLKIRFKRWGKLWASANTHLHKASRARQIERRDQLLGTLLVRSPLPGRLKRRLTGLRYAKKQSHVSATPERPNCFVVEVYNPNDHSIDISLAMMAGDRHSPLQYQRLIKANPGYVREIIPIVDIARVVDLAKPFNAMIMPNEVKDGTTLYFGLMDFAFDTSRGPVEQRVKCVIWDLDNTLWDGVLVEDGLDSLSLKPGVFEVIRSLDERGILHSIVSKNNKDEALNALSQFGLQQYMLSPQISWNPKSAGVQAVARALNIGLDSLLFIDDSAFEREEVAVALPGVRVVDAAQLLTLPRRSDCDVPITEESRNRRSFYRQASARDAEAAAFEGDYINFLKDCAIELTIAPMSEANLTRAHELSQRTNQMNFSGNRYTRDVLEALLHSGGTEAFVVACQDRFGSYGTVGLCVVDRREPRVIDLMFSCRVQSKRVEHAFIAWLLQDLIRVGARDVYFNYRKTQRNEQSGRVFDDMGLEVVNERDGITSLVFCGSRPIPDDGLIKVRVAASTCVAANTP